MSDISRHCTQNITKSHIFNTIYPFDLNWHVFQFFCAINIDLNEPYCIYILKYSRGISISLDIFLKSLINCEALKKSTNGCTHGTNLLSVYIKLDFLQAHVLGGRCKSFLWFSIVQCCVLIGTNISGGCAFN